MKSPGVVDFIKFGKVRIACRFRHHVQIYDVEQNVSCSENHLELLLDHLQAAGISVRDAPEIPI